MNTCKYPMGFIQALVNTEGWLKFIGDRKIQTQNEVDFGFCISSWLLQKKRKNLAVTIKENNNSGTVLEKLGFKPESKIEESTTIVLV